MPCTLQNVSLFALSLPCIRQVEFAVSVGLGRLLIGNRDPLSVCLCLFGRRRHARSSVPPLFLTSLPPSLRIVGWKESSSPLPPSLNGTLIA